MNRNSIQKKNIFLGLGFKGVGVALNLLLVPLLISFLNKEQYGVWVTVFSIVNWIFTFDIGLGHGLRNRLTESLSRKDYIQASGLISTTYILLTAFALLIFLLGSLSIVWLDFQSILNFSGEDNSFLRLFVFLSLLFTVLNFILSLYKKLYLAVHKSYVVELANDLFLGLYVLAIIIWFWSGWEKNLISLILLFGSLNAIVSIVVTYIFLRTRKQLKIKWTYFDRTEAKSLFGLGGNFFTINLCLLVILSTDNVIITNTLSPSDVTDYSVVQRIFQLLIIAFNVVLASSWGLYSEAIVKHDYDWIEGNIRKMRLYLLGIIITGIVILFSMDAILRLWLGADVIKVPEGLVLANLVYTVAFCYANIYMFFINATGDLRLQMFLFLAGALVNVPLSIFFIRFLDSSTGVMLATILSILPLLIFMPLQSSKKIKKFRERAS